MNRHYPSVAGRAGHRCEYCRAPETVFNFPFEVEHFIPDSRGGGDAPGNLCVACRACNLRKSDRLFASDVLTQEQVTLFNPRVHDWNDHFRADLASGEIQGRTPTGRATAACLDFNHALHLAARQLWIRLGLFP